MYFVTLTGLLGILPAIPAQYWGPATSGYNWNQGSNFGQQEDAQSSIFGHKEAARSSSFGHQEAARSSGFGYQEAERSSDFGHQEAEGSSSFGHQELDWSSTNDAPLIKQVTQELQKKEVSFSFFLIL